MYKTIRMLPAALLLLLLGTACTNDPADTPAATGLPLVLENVYIGAQTRVTPTPYDNPEGSTLTATLTWGNVTSTGTYTYRSGQWTSDEPAYWQDPKDLHTLTLHTPEPENDMPAEEGFTTANWHEYDILTYTNDNVKPGTTTFELTHTRAQLCIALVKGDGMTDAELAAAKVTANNIGMLSANGAHYAIFDPGTKIASVNIDINGSTYTYTPDTDTDITLEKGKCTILTLKVNKVGVSGITVSGEDWQNVTGTAAIDESFQEIACNGTDNITIPDEATKLLITGTLTSKDISAINSANDQITHLYVTATAEENVWKSLCLGKNGVSNRTTISVCLTQATHIGEYAFQSCDALTTVNLPEATIIGKSAFWACDALASISLPTATTIGDNVFYGCNKLTNISLPEATNIGESAFWACDALTTVSLPKATNIGEYAFAACDALTIISLSKDAEIEANAFWASNSLTTLYLLDLTTDEFKADEATYTSLGDVNWQHIYYNGGEWHRDENN